MLVGISPIEAQGSHGKHLMGELSKKPIQEEILSVRLEFVGSS
jgi:hypothetical protein